MSDADLVEPLLASTRRWPAATSRTTIPRNSPRAGRGAPVGWAFVSALRGHGKPAPL